MVSIPKIINAISKLQGSKAKVTLGAKQLKMLAQKEKGVALVLDKMKLKDPKLDLAYQVKSNYNVATFRLRDGKESVVNGAISVQNPGTTESIIKYRLNVGENGNALRTSGFADFGKELDIDDQLVSILRKNKRISTETKSGSAARHTMELNEDELTKLASQYTGTSEETIKGTLQGWQSTGWHMLRNFFAGKPKGAVIMEAADELPQMKYFDKEAFKSLFGIGRKGKDLEPGKLINKVGDSKMSGSVSKNIHADVSDIDDFLAKNSSKLRESDIKSLEDWIQELNGDLIRVKDQFAAATDEIEKVQLAREYKNIERRLQNSEMELKCLNATINKVDDSKSINIHADVSDIDDFIAHNSSKIEGGVFRKTDGFIQKTKIRLTEIKEKFAAATDDVEKAKLVFDYQLEMHNLKKFEESMNLIKEGNFEKAFEKLGLVIG